MDRITRNLTVITVCFIAVAGLSGCAATANNVNADANAGATGPVAFGKFRLVRNGYEMKVGEGIFANSATLQVYDADGDREMKGKVGRNGEFSWALEPGSYRIVSVGFKYHGERVAPPANFAFEVSAGHKATYVGTIMLEVSFEAGQYGTTGTVDRSHEWFGRCWLEVPARVVVDQADELVLYVRKKS